MDPGLIIVIILLVYVAARVIVTVYVEHQLNRIKADVLKHSDVDKTE